MTAFRDREIGMVRYEESGKVREEPGYMCGHCNCWIIITPRRVRERVRCKQCDRLICERTSLCAENCIPIADLCKDKFEGRTAQKYGRLANAVLSGAKTEKEALTKGLVWEF